MTPRSKVRILPLMELAAGTFDSSRTEGDRTLVNFTPAAGDRLILLETIRVYFRVSPSKMGLGAPASESDRFTVGLVTEVLTVTYLLARFGSAGLVARAGTGLETTLGTAGTLMVTLSLTKASLANAPRLVNVSTLLTTV